MEGHKNKVTMVVAEINCVNDENQQLTSMVKSMTSKCYYLQKQISSLLQHQKRVDGSQYRSSFYYAHTGRNEQGGEKGKKNVKWRKGKEDYQLPSKKWKINYMQSEQIVYGISSSVDDTSPCCQGESSNKVHQLMPNRGSGEQIQAAKPKRVVVARTRSEESARRWVPVAEIWAKDDKKQSTSKIPIADNQLIPNARISTSSPFPTITLDLTDDQPNPGLPLQLPSLAADSFQHSTPVPNNMGLVFDQSQLDHLAIMNSVASIKADPNFTAALGIAIAGSVLKLGDPAQGMMPKFPPPTNGSTL